MNKRILLGSCIGQVIGKMLFLFEKPLPDLKVLCIPTAANVYAPESRGWLSEDMQPFTDLGITLQTFDLEGKSKADVEAALQDADAVYVTGGNTYYLLEKMKSCGFKPLIADFVRRGGLYIGSSAGSVVACPEIGFIRDMDDPTQAKLDDDEGLGLADLYIMPHADHPEYGPVGRQIAKDPANAGKNFIALKDNQALLITNNYTELFEAA